MKEGSKPTPEQFGYSGNNSFDGDISGWQYEGGEEAYEEALRRWQFIKDNGLSEEDMVNDITMPHEI